MRVTELFGGIGAVRKAFIRAGLPYEGVSYVEVDPKCVASYNALYGTDFAPIDIRTFSPPDVPVDLLMHSSPCQDVSRAGAKRGARPGSGTRSSLLFESVRVLGEMDPLPTWVVFENVKGMLDGPAGDAFITYLEAMEALGYETSYAVLNAMDFGIPQKRERLFAVSHLGKDFSFQALERIPMRPLTDFLQADADPAI